MTGSAQPIRPHVPLRPLWICRACGAPWPCGTARLTLLADYRNSRIALAIHLAGMMYDAVEDLRLLDSRDVPRPEGLHARFLGWATLRTPRHPQPPAA
ncbi:hypothetical protein [Micromonospora sp. RTGN7]|uniref:hypothetical protein n=1 Tax=Micromonospora sp. RTGN7 TaxID=3016526 RepID=UPI0029FEF128|nr:hypothetical protein [Micromonospora sp. RTGN7]